MDIGIGKIIKDGNGNAIIFTALAAAAIANTIPTPFDAIYFKRQQILKQKLEAGEISIESYWWHDIGEYYVWTSLWYASLFGILYAMNNSSKTNVKILGGLLGVGAVVGVGYLNIRKDKEIAELKRTVVIKKSSDSTNVNSAK